MILVDIICVVISVGGFTTALNAKHQHDRGIILKQISESHEAISKICREIANK